MAAQADKYDCRTCRWGRHCDDTHPAPFPKWVINGEALRTCPLPKITELSRYMLRLVGPYQHHMLPRAGGMLDQPNLYLEAMEVLVAAFKRIAAETKQA